jgi:myo-inositol 2-dehydrogenase/D-chiro-inositol 1-dehydrogenase
MSRSASYGYDQRCEIFGSEGRVQVGNVHETSTVLSTCAGIMASKYQHSFPQRFHQAFGLELDAFGDCLLLASNNKKVYWPVTKDDCIRVQRIADAAQASAKTGLVVEITDDDSTR